jgi:hypothetical protein
MSGVRIIGAVVIGAAFWPRVLVGCFGEDPPFMLAKADAGVAQDAEVAQEDGDAAAVLPEPDLPCDPSEIPADGIHVSADGSDEAGNGSPLLPFKSIGAGVAAAAAAFKSTVYVAEGIYPEALELDEARQGLLVKGGWLRSGDTWRRDCESGFRARTVIASPSNVGVRVTGVTKPTGLEALTIATKATGRRDADAAGESCIGVWVTGDGSAFRLSRVKVIAGGGGAGGEASTPMQQGAVSCNGHDDCTTAPSVGRTGDSAPAPSAQGTYDAAGFVPIDGLGGGSGGPGTNGTPGGLGAGHDVCVHGTTPSGNAPPGKCGCGGLPGLGGRAGRGGGASVALLVYGAGAIVSVDDTALVAGKAGDGSAGAAGALGGKPGSSSNGAPASCPSDNGPSTSPGPACGCVGKNEKGYSGGLAGGHGAAGGNGGTGSGGGGGDSIGFVTVGTAKVLVEGSFGQIVHGPAGLGAGGASEGRAMERFAAP